MYYPGMRLVRELVIIKFEINLNCCDLRSTWVSHPCTIAYVIQCLYGDSKEKANKATV